MFLSFFLELKAAKVPVTLREYLALQDGLKAGLAQFDIDAFYFLARASLVKDERFIDRFDQVFSRVFKGALAPTAEAGLAAAGIAEEWLRRLAEKHLSDEEKALVESLGGFDALMETLKKRLQEQKDRHQGGSKWIGTAGTSPYGAHGYNPEGVRIGQEASRHRRAVKVWDERAFRDYDDGAELGTRAIKVALKRLRKWVRDSAREEFDLPGTVTSTAKAGLLDIRMVPERRNAVKVLLLLDVGGSMDDHVLAVEELFSAARGELKHLEFFYFHNCPYERLWRDNARRQAQTKPTDELIRTFGPDWKLILVGDAAMAPYEITHPGGSVEHWNAEAGAVWLARLTEKFPSAIWLNPMPDRHWPYSASTALINRLMEGRMFPLTLEGLERGMKALGRRA